jgi:hypothetical protein
LPFVTDDALALIDMHRRAPRGNRTGRGPARSRRRGTRLGCHTTALHRSRRCGNHGIHRPPPDPGRNHVISGVDHGHADYNDAHHDGADGDSTHDDRSADHHDPDNGAEPADDDNRAGHDHRRHDDDARRYGLDVASVDELDVVAGGADR